MYRTAIFCFYNKQGIAEKYVDFLLEDLKKTVDFLIVVVNGKIKNIEVLKKYSNFFIVRDNKGYDICAYKEVLLNKECLDVIKGSQELVLVNNSFYGPFIPFASIFKKMEYSTADFWGISTVEKNLTKHIQSYFYVFRKRVIERGELFRYFDKHIEPDRMDYLGVCAAFENGLFSNLIQSGYRYDAFKRDIDCDIYENPYGSIMGDKLPILKRKVFAKQFFKEGQIANTMRAIQDNYNYDTDLIIKDVLHTYGIDISKISSKIDNTIVKDLIQEKDLVPRKEINQFIAKHKSIYIYGAGKEAGNIFSHFFFYQNNPGLRGFIISDNQERKNKIYRGYPVYYLSEVKKDNPIAIVVGLNKENSRDVFMSLSNIENVKFLWKSIDVKRQRDDIWKN